MKIFLHYEDHEDETHHKSLKIKLPKSWRSGPTSQLLSQFVESYNASSHGEHHTLIESQLHLAHRVKGDDGSLDHVPLASDAIVNEVMADRDDVMIVEGPSQTLEELKAAKDQEEALKQKELEGTAKCVRFGCQNRFPKGGPYPACSYHKSPPVFHETVKFWSCCPTKKAYDWEGFQEIPGCCSGVCTEVREEENGGNGKLFLGGCDLREAAGGGEGSQLRSIDDFNKGQAGANNSDASAPALDRLQMVMEEMDIEKELFDQVVDGIKKDLGERITDPDEMEKAVIVELGQKLKKAMKAIAVEQLRIR